MAVPDYLQDTAKDLAKNMTATYSAPLDTSTFMGDQFIAGQDQAQKDAYKMATEGVGSYQTYLDSAKDAASKAATTIGGLGALTGPMTGQQLTDYMSPYQSSVIDETLRQYDLSRQGGMQSIKDAAVSSGGFGGGREGAMLGQYMGDSLANKAGITSNLLQQGYMDAQNRRAQDFAAQQQIANMQTGMGTTQMNLSNFARQNMGADIQALGSVGAMQQAHEQAKLNAQQQQLQAQAYEPYGRLGQYASGITGLAGGMASPQYQDPGASNPWQTALGTLTGLGGLYGQIFNKPAQINIG